MSDSSDSKTKRTPITRRRFIVDKPFQYRLIGTLVSIWFANTIFFTLVLYFFYQGHLTRFYDLVPRPEMRPLVDSSTLFPLAIAFVAVFGVVMVGIVGLYLSNQIAGPLYRVKLCMEKVGKGEWDFDVRFRERDFLRDMPAVFNGMLGGLKEQTAADIEKLKELEGALEELPAEQKLVTELREQKEALVGVAKEQTGQAGSPEEQVSLAVH